MGGARRISVGESYRRTILDYTGCFVLDDADCHVKYAKYRERSNKQQYVCIQAGEIAAAVTRQAMEEKRRARFDQKQKQRVPSQNSNTRLGCFRRVECICMYAVLMFFCSSFCYR